MPHIPRPESAKSVRKPVWHTYKDKNGTILGPEQFDGDWPFVDKPPNIDLTVLLYQRD